MPKPIKKPTPLAKPTPLQAKKSAKTPRPAAKKPPKVREDVNTLAFRILQESTGQAPKTPDPIVAKVPAAVARGRKGGPARAAKLTPQQRSEIARKAANARWGATNQPADPG
jgi:hypothetical protein